jgi:hypothetical protein
MRFRARSLALLAGLLLLALPSLAAATPHPIAKPKTITPIQPVSTQPSPPPASPPPPPASPPPPAASPPPPPASPPPSNPPAQGSVNTGSAAGHAPAKAAVVVIAAQGGRDQSGIAVPAPPPPSPTPLALVTAGQRVSSPGTDAPAWKIAVLALLAASEAFLVVRLLRSRSGDLSPAQ